MWLAAVAIVRTALTAATAGRLELGLELVPALAIVLEAARADPAGGPDPALPLEMTREAAIVETAGKPGVVGAMAGHIAFAQPGLMPTSLMVVPEAHGLS